MDIIFVRVKKKLLDLLAWRAFRIGFLILGFASLILIRRVIGGFGLSLGYIYITLISLAGFWFGVWGGVMAATVASLVLLFEINIFRYWLFRDLVVSGILVRFIVYYSSGIALGTLALVEKRLRERLRALAYYDELTGCVNFRWTMQLLENEVLRCQRYGKELTIVMIDIDFFKKINDTYGHLVGNDVLASFADTVKGAVRNVDVVGRYGGEEFLVILPEANLKQALMVVERIKRKVSQAKIHSQYLKRQEGLSVKFSAGVASYPFNGRQPGDLISVVDNALYQAKRQGRDRTFIERRRWIRTLPFGSMRLEVVDDGSFKKPESIKIVNLSQQGALLSSAGDILSDEFLCRLWLPEQPHSWETKAKVIHTHKEGRTWYIGIFFYDLPESLQKEISRQIHPQGPESDSLAF